QAKLSAPSGRTVTVNYATAAGTATAGTDYQSKTGTLSFSPGTTTQTITVTVNGDTTPEQDETLLVNLSSPVNVTIADSQAVGTIQDDDSLVVDDPTVVEGDAGPAVLHYTVRLLAARDSDVTVRYATANGTATAGTDYLATSGLLTFAAGQTSKTVDV